MVSDAPVPDSNIKLAISRSPVAVPVGFVTEIELPVPIFVDTLCTTGCARALPADSKANKNTRRETPQDNTDLTPKASEKTAESFKFFKEVRFINLKRVLNCQIKCKVTRNQLQIQISHE